MDRQKTTSTVGKKCRQFFLQNLLVTLTMCGALVGFIVGFVVEPTHPSTSALMWIGMPGELYIRMLKLMIVPLVVSSVISGAAAMDPRSNCKISVISLFYIFVMNGVAPIIASIICVLVQPGRGVDSGVTLTSFQDQAMATVDIFADLLRNIIPDNMVASSFRQSQTKYVFTTVSKFRSNATHNWTEQVQEVSRKYVGEAGTTNVLGLIVISVLFGVGSVSMKEQGKPFLNFFRSAMDITIRVLRVLMWTTPVGVASLVAKTIAGTSDVEDTFRKLGMYFLTVMISLMLWGFVLMPIFYYYIRRKNPFRFFGSIVPSMMIVFATTSTVMALPESFHSLEQKNKIDQRVTRFVAPLAATIGRPGSCIYISTSCIFIIQMLGMESDIGNILLVIVLTWISALAIPSVTGASLVTVLILLTALNIPAESAAMLFALEFFVDRVRSTVNLITQLVGVVAMDKFVKLDDNVWDYHVTGTDDVMEELHPAAATPGEAANGTDGVARKPETDIKIAKIGEGENAFMRI